MTASRVASRNPAAKPDQPASPEQMTPAEQVAVQEEAMQEAIEEVVAVESKDPDSPVSEYKRVYHITVGVLIAVAVVGVIFFIAISLP